MQHVLEYSPSPPSSVPATAARQSTCPSVYMPLKAAIEISATEDEQRRDAVQEAEVGSFSRARSA